MPGVQGVHRLPGAVAVTADSWFRARKAVEALTVQWSAPRDRDRHGRRRLLV